MTKRSRKGAERLIADIEISNGTRSIKIDVDPLEWFFITVIVIVVTYLVWG